MKLKFLQVISPNTCEIWKKNNAVWGESGAYIDKPDAMVNIVYFHKDAERASGYLKKMEDLGGYILCDSGGFQRLSLGMYNNPKFVVSIQQKLCKYGVILDYPPYKFQKNIPEVFDEPNFEFCLDQTIMNTKIMVDNIYRSDFKLYGVIQGTYPKYMIKWFEELKKFITTDFWCVSPKPSSLVTITWTLLFAKYLGIRNLHILGIGSNRSIVMLEYLKKRLGNDFNIVSFDSSTIYQTAIRRIMYNLTDKITIEARYVGTKNEANTEEIFPCKCKVCANYDTSLFKLPTAPYIVSEHLASHNWQMLNNYWKLIEKDPEKYLKEMKEFELVDKIINKFEQNKESIFDRFFQRQTELF